MNLTLPPTNATVRRWIRKIHETGLEFTIPVLALAVGYLFGTLRASIFGTFDVAQFSVSVSILGATLLLLALAPIMLRRWPGVTSFLLLGMFVGFLVNSAALDSTSAAHGLFASAIVPVSLIIAFVSFGDTLTKDPPVA